MSVVNAGLPNQPDKVLGGLPLGYEAYMANTGPTKAMADGSVWLRQGSIVQKSAYPAAGLIDHLKAHIATEVATAAFGAVTGVATDGAGNFVACTNDATNVYSSSDNGATWTARAHGMGGTINAAVWTGTRFVVGGCDGGGVYYMASSSNGVAWASSYSTTPGGTATAGTMRLIWTGSNVVALAQNSAAAGAVITSPTGLTGSWAARNLSSNPLLQVEIGCAQDGSGKVVAMYGGGGTISVSTDHGQTWAGVMCGFSANGYRPVGWANGVIALLPASSATYSYTSTPQTAASWAPGTTGLAGLNFVGTNAFSASGRVYSPSASADGVWLYSDDGTTWRTQAVALQQTDQTAVFSVSAARVAYGNGVFVFGRNSASAKIQTAASTPTVTNGVGAVSIANNPTFYNRVK